RTRRDAHSPRWWRRRRALRPPARRPIPDARSRSRLIELRVLEKLLEAVTRAGPAAHDRADGHLHRVANLLVGEIVEVTKHDELPETRRQLLERHRDLRPHLAGD